MDIDPQSATLMVFGVVMLGVLVLMGTAPWSRKRDR